MNKMAVFLCVLVGLVVQQATGQEPPSPPPPPVLPVWWLASLQAPPLVTLQWGASTGADRGVWSSFLKWLVQLEQFYSYLVYSGVVLEAPVSSTTFGSIFSFRCEEGLIPNATFEAVCGVEGQWSPDPANHTCIVAPLLRIEQDEIYVSEGNIVEVCVQVTPSDLNFTVSLQQTASSRSELAISPQVLRFFPAEAEKCFIVEALEDSTLEETLESYTLELIASTAAVVFNDPQITINILDRDYLVIEPAISSLQVPEGDTATACAVIGEGSSATTLDRAVVLKVVGSATGATPGLDFSVRIVNPDIFLFLPGSPVGSEACLSFTIFQGNITEPEPESIANTAAGSIRYWRLHSQGYSNV